MVPQCNLGCTQFTRHAIQHPAAQARAQRTHGFAFGDHALDDAVGVLILDVKRHTQLRQVIRQHLLGEARLLLIQIHRHDVEPDRCARLQMQQHIEHGVAVLAARQTGHHLVAVVDHVVIGDSLSHHASQPLGELVRLVRRFALLVAARVNVDYVSVHWIAYSEILRPPSTASTCPVT